MFTSKIAFRSSGIGLLPRILPSRAYTTTSPNFYEILDVPLNALIKDIKVQFKKLSKKLHPDLNSHLDENAKVANNDTFVQIVTAYDTLKDIKKKKQYDQMLKSGGNLRGGSHVRKNQEWHNKYYGEAKYYSKSGSYYSASGLNTKRHRVHNFNREHSDNLRFSGHHVNYGDRFDVEHFDYNEHLNRNLKFEQRIISKHLTDEDRASILRQLNKEGDTSKISEELITKHLMRQMHHSYNKNNNQNSFAPQGGSGGQKNPYMYHGPQNGRYNGEEEESLVLLRTFMVLGGAGTMWLLYSTLTG